MVVIYCIEDINDIKYIGSTTQKLGARLTGHKQDVKRGNCSSRELNLYNCIIYELETCSQEQRKERESYHINNTECVNINKLNYTRQECQREYQRKNKEKISKKNREYQRGYYEKNKEKVNNYKRQHRLDNIELYKKRAREKYIRMKQKKLNAV